MPPDSLASLRALLARFPEGYTPGPWSTYNDGFEAGVAAGVRPARAGECSLFDCGVVYDEFICGGEPHEGWLDVTAPNTCLIALSPDLVDALRWAEGEIARLTAALDTARREGAEEERGRVVCYLLQEDTRIPRSLHAWAVAIERGDHLEAP
jgi:hypothetical protein